MKNYWCDREGCDVAVLDSTERQPWSTADLNAQTLPAVEDLESGIISHRRFPLRKWYYANPLWYYHAPSTEHRLHTDPKFYELVDDNLRELCKHVLEAGLFTTPSCQGHFYARERFEKVWDELVRESALVRATGLIVRDCETDQAYRFKDAEFQPAWAGFASFYEEASQHQHTGYIGLAVPPDRHELIERLKADSFTTPTAAVMFDEELTEILKQPLFSIYVDPETPEERDEAWRAVTTYIKSVVRSPAPVDAKG